ncbi:MAG: lipopolysaccharide heptosyltransferase II [Betaproteobacteria bacterium]|nr:lipopolysaccharide heptosyltransferase II [Betaproteobacteria bacterium]NBY32995.1 lipopolysaccharide heptosyltransferase II [Betaproteobacteria bacterium]
MTASLLIAPQWIGDAVMTEPLLRVLAQRGETLSVAAMPWVAPIYRAMPHVTEVIELPFPRGGLHWGARRNLASQWRGRFERAYVGPNSWKSALLPWMAGIPVRVGYHGETRFGLLNHRLPNPEKNHRGAMVAHYLALAQMQADSGVQPKLDLSLDLLKATLLNFDLKLGAYAVFAPGAEYGPAKRWPAAYFAELGLRTGLPLVLMGSAKEAALCDEIAQRIHQERPKTARNLAGKTDLSQAMALIASSQAMLSNDSGLMHVAAAMGVPQVAVFGSSSPLHTPPMSDKAVVLWLKNEASYQPPLDCAPCFERSCPLGHLRCLNDLTPERVEQAWREVVSG